MVEKVLEWSRYFFSGIGEATAGNPGAFIAGLAVGIFTARATGLMISGLLGRSILKLFVRVFKKRRGTNEKEDRNSFGIICLNMFYNELYYVKGKRPFWISAFADCCFQKS